MGKYSEWAKTRKVEIDGKDSIIAELHNNVAELRNNINTIQARFEALKNMTLWAELASGKTIHAGDTVRYLLYDYVCIKDHTKTLLRAPTNGEYWQLAEQ